MTGAAPSLTELLGVELDPDLVTQAVTHRSYSYEHDGAAHNERLEFLGDAVLELVVTEYLYTAYPDRPEGDLARIRASLVNTYVLADVARELGDGGLGAHLRLGRGEELTGGRDKHSILADTLEAVFGAVYLAHGLEVSRSVVERMIGERLQVVPDMGAALDWKTSLQERCAELGRPRVHYEITSTGPDHDKTFTATALVGEEALGGGSGRTKKEAEQKAAEQAWSALDRDAS